MAGFTGQEIRRTAVLKRDLSRIRVRVRRSVGRQWKVKAPQWNDPYPWVAGSFPEKLVFAYLAGRGVPFVFQSMLPDYEGTLTVEEFRPDFVIPQWKVIIEVQGEYWHSLPDQAEHDAYKFTVYSLMGYKVYWFWESDILSNLPGLMKEIPELSTWSGHEDWVWEVQADDLAGLRATNSNSRSIPMPKLTARSRRKRRL